MSSASSLLTPFCIVNGTWEFDGHDGATEWWQAHSPFVEFMATEGFVYTLVAGEPFIWHTALEGIDWLRYFGKKAKHTAWRAAAHNLKQYLRDVPVQDRNILAHSHGGNVVAYACAGGLEINNLITLSTPIRGDMRAVYTAAAIHINHWTHVHSDRSDWMQLLGGLFDGQFGVHRGCPQADHNISIAKVGHSKIVKDPAFFRVWKEQQLLQHLKKDVPHV